jgi:hypothetical protein
VLDWKRGKAGQKEIGSGWLEKCKSGGLRSTEAVRQETRKKSVGFELARLRITTAFKC